MEPHIRTDRNHVVLTCEVCRAHARMTVAEAKALAKKLDDAIAFAGLSGLGIAPPPEPAPAKPSDEIQLLLAVATVLRSQYGPPAPLMSSPECRALLDARMAPFAGMMARAEALDEFPQVHG